MISDFDLKTRLALAKIPVVALNNQGDFVKWPALRKLVGAYGMGNALLFSIPKSELAGYMAKLSRGETLPATSSRSSSSSSSSSSSAISPSGATRACT